MWIYTKTLITFWLGRHKEVNLRQKRKWPHSDENNTVCQRRKWAGHSNLRKQDGAGRQAPALHKVLKPLGLCPPRWKVLSCDLHHHRETEHIVEGQLWPAAGPLAQTKVSQPPLSHSDVQIVPSQSPPEYCWPCGNHTCGGFLSQVFH